jgi:hypothetical protein
MENTPINVFFLSKKNNCFLKFYLENRRDLGGFQLNHQQFLLDKYKIINKSQKKGFILKHNLVCVG